jgi:hypothetical protein
METREVKYPVVKMEFKSVTEETPVTRMTWEEEEVTIKVPHVTVKKVPCKKVVRLPLVCSLPCHGPSFLPGEIYPDMILPGVPLKGDEIVPPPDAKKGEPKKEEPKKEEPKKEEPKKDAPKK